MFISGTHIALFPVKPVRISQQILYQTNHLRGCRLFGKVIVTQEKIMLYQLLIFALLFSALEWYGEHKKIQLLIYATKPTAMILIILWTSLHIDFGNLLINDRYVSNCLVSVGMIFCLIGDIFLINSENYFLPGILAFLLGQILYIVGFDRVFPPKENFLIGSIILLIFILIVSIGIYRILAKGIDASGKKQLKIPVAIYALVISVMLYSAIFR